jgi:hypothetical protein
VALSACDAVSPDLIVPAKSAIWANTAVEADVAVAVGAKVFALVATEAVPAVNAVEEEAIVFSTTPLNEPNL